MLFFVFLRIRVPPNGSMNEQQFFYIGFSNRVFSHRFHHFLHLGKPLWTASLWLLGFDGGLIERSMGVDPKKKPLNWSQQQKMPMFRKYQRAQHIASSFLLSKIHHIFIIYTYIGLVYLKYHIQTVLGGENKATI